MKQKQAHGYVDVTTVITRFGKHVLFLLNMKKHTSIHFKAIFLVKTHTPNTLLAQMSLNTLQNLDSQEMDDDKNTKALPCL